MARIITKELAIKIIDKLKATKVNSGKAHDEYAVEERGQVVAVTSLRRGSEKDLGHDHIPRDLHIGPNKAKQLGQCPLSRKGYIAILQEQGLVPPDDDNPHHAATAHPR